MMKIHPLFAAGSLALAVAACNEKPQPTPQPQTQVDQPVKGQKAIDECPRSDKGECL